MKRIILPALSGALCILLVILVMTTHVAKKEAEPAGHTYVDYVSALQGECFLCGVESGPITLRHWGEDNVGVINLNTFELMRLEIKRYNDDGQLLQEAAGYMQSIHLSGENSYAHAYIFPDSMYARVQLTGIQYNINRDAIQSKLCQSCLDTVNSLIFPGDVLAEYAIVGLAERTIHPLVGRNAQFTIGNYIIECSSKNNDALDLLIYHCLD